jgi:hypothetical protein
MNGTFPTERQMFAVRVHASTQSCFTVQRRNEPFEVVALYRADFQMA